MPTPKAHELTPTVYVDAHAQANGDHEIHLATCPALATVDNRVYVGDFRDAEDAVRHARRHYAQSRWCARCAPSQGTR